jgi:2-keto-3-deoxy-L-rhamnonate aldolase RhmA
MTDHTDTPGHWRNPHFVAGPTATRAAESLNRGDQLRTRLTSGLALGTFLIELPTRNTLGAIALAGFDFVVIDMEHSSIDFTTLEALIGASNAAGLVTLVRPWNTQPGMIGKVLDCGAHGIMAPHIDTAERARDVVAQARFAPRGHRGFSPLSKFDALASPLQSLCDATVVVVQIEGREGLSRVNEIATVAGLDAVFIGPYDLSLSLNVPPSSPPVFEAAASMASSVPQGVHMGLYIDDASKCGEWAARRFALQCVSFDGRMLADAARSVVTRAREAHSRKNK